MSDAIYRMLVPIFGRPQPIEWWLLGADLAIVLLIIWLDVPEKWHKRTIRRRMAAAVLLMRKGKEIEVAVPRAGNIDVNTITPWKESVDVWMRETNSFLGGCSPQASAAFVHHMGGAGATVHYGGIARDAHDYYVFLLARTNNLRAIMEKPDVYF